MIIHCSALIFFIFIVIFNSESTHVDYCELAALSVDIVTSSSTTPGFASEFAMVGQTCPDDDLFSSIFRNGQTFSTIANFSDFASFTPRVLHHMAISYLILPNTMEDFVQAITKISQLTVNEVGMSSFSVFTPSEDSKNDHEVHMEKYINVVQSVNFPIDSRVFFIYVSPKLRVIWESYSIKGKSFYNQLARIQIPTQKPEDVVQNVDTVMHRRNNFMGSKIVGASKADESYTSWKMLKDGEIKSELDIKDFSLHIYFDLKFMLNFTDDLVIVTWSNRQYDGQQLYRAVVNELMTTEADICLLQSTLVPFRAIEQSFLQPTYFSTVFAFFKQPTHGTIQNFVLMPFEIPLWFSFLLSWILTAIGIKICYFMADRMYGNSWTSEDEEFFSNVFIWLVTANCQKSWYSVPKRGFLRAVFIMGSLSAVLTYIAYSAAIVSVMSVNVHPIKDLTGLIKWNYKFTVHEHSATLKYFLQRLINQNNLKQSILTTDTKHEVEHFLNAKISFLSYPALFFMSAQELGYPDHFLDSNVAFLSATPSPYHSGMFVKKDSPYKEILNFRILMIKESGLNDRYINSYNAKNGGLHFAKGKAEKVQTQFDPVAMYDTATTFLIMIFGMLLAFLGMLFENFYHFKYRFR